MKINIIFLLLLFASTVAWGQSVPQGMNYQAIARGLDGEPLADQDVALQITLHTQANADEIAYREIHKVTTNQFGLFTIVIGGGTVETGQFDKVPWSTEDVWIQVAVRGSNREYIVISDSRMLSVPYAFHAATATQLVDQNGNTGFRVPDPGVPANVWSVFGNSNTDEDDVLGTTDCADLVMVTNDTARLSILCNGDIVIENSLSIGEDLDVGNNLHVGNDAVIDMDVDLNVDGATDLNGTLDVNNMSATNLSGTLTVDKATDLNSTLNVDGATDLNGTLDVNNMSATNLSGTLTVDKATDLNSTLTVDGATDLNSSLNVDGSSSMNGQVTINAAVGGGDGSYGAYPLRVQGSDQGIAVRVNGTRNNNKNFITFWDGNGPQGRVEGQTLGELTTSFEYIWYNSMEALNTAFQVAIVAVDLIGVDDFDAAAVGGLQLAAAVAEWAKVNIELIANVGVSFESGGADYAEWLKKANPAESFSPGDIVGVRGGLISKNTVGADHLMVISRNPVVLGNMPPSGEESLYEKVAFLGQVNVKTTGSVSVGDYILPSGRNDGFGKAVGLEDMTIEDYRQIVGVAWSGSSATGLSYPNVAVGINANDIAVEMSGQQKDLEAVKSTLNLLIEYLKTQDAEFDATVFDLPAMTPVEDLESQIDGIDIEQGNEASWQDMVRFFDANPDMLEEILADARRRLDEKEIDYRKFEQTRQLLEDQEYIKAMLRDIQN